MIAYKYDSETKLYVGTQQCQLDPLESELAGKDVWLLPANCTFKAPLTFKEGFNIVWSDTNSTWKYEEIPVEPEREAPSLEDMKTAKI